MKVEIVRKTLNFRFEAGTSRGTYRTRDIRLVVITDEDGRRGIGECAPLPRLSVDDVPDYEEKLAFFARRLSLAGQVDYDTMRAYPSIIFGIEGALLHLHHQDLVLFKSPFSAGRTGITINGLVWMGDYQTMQKRLEEKISQGFNCIKIKIGAIDFERELELIKKIRSDFNDRSLTIRVDANGAFAPDSVMGILDRLAPYSLHSIEQPIRAGQTDELARIVKSSPIPVALDEELIPCTGSLQKYELLNKVRPHFIVLKPSLHGGIIFTQEWIDLAGVHNTGYWLTSALESNIGLNLIAQYCGRLNPSLPQGLGTGLLYKDNIDFPLVLRGEHMYFDPAEVPKVDFDAFLSSGKKARAKAKAKDDKKAKSARKEKEKAKDKDRKKSKGKEKSASKKKAGKGK